MGLLNPSPFIDDQQQQPPASAAWQGQGPQQAAQGNLGGLQRALIGRVPPQAAGSPASGGGALSLAGSNPIISEDAQRQLETALMSRIRSPDELQNATEARRGALEALQQAVSAKPNNYTWDTHFMEGIMHAPQGLSAGDAFQYGVSNAMKASRESQDETYKADVANAKNRLTFEQSEDKSADQAEKNALSDTARIAIAQNKLVNGKNGAAQQRYKWTKDGLIDFQTLDNNGVPSIVLPASKDMNRYFDAALRRATTKAEGMEFPSSQAREDWIHRTASTDLALLTDADNSMAPRSSPANPVEASKQEIPAKSASVEQQSMNEDSLRLLNEELQKEQAAGNTDNVAALQREIARVQQRSPHDTSDQLEQRLTAVGAKSASINNKPGVGEPTPVGTVEASQVAKGTPSDVTKGTTTPPAAGTVTSTEPVLRSKMEQQRDKAYVEQTEKSNAKILDSITSQGNQANDALATVNNIQQLRDRFTPNKFAGVKQELGGYMDALGLTKGGLPAEARTLQQVSRMIEEQVNNRMTEENGVQTEGDTQRFRSAYANIRDTPAAFDFSLGMLKERALRQQERMRIATESGERNRSNSKIQQDWIEYRDKQLGPMMVNTEKGPIWRHDFIERGITATMEQHPDADPDYVRKLAEEKWLEKARVKK